MSRTYVLDACVAVAAIRVTEPSHDRARQHLEGLFHRREEIVVPALFDIEITSALVRASVDVAVVQSYLDCELATRTLVTLGPRAARAISAIAAQTRLRAADAAYVWVAVSHGVSLVTLDREIEDRASKLCQVEVLL